MVAVVVAVMSAISLILGLDGVIVDGVEGDADVVPSEILLLTAGAPPPPNLWVRLGVLIRHLSPGILVCDALWIHSSTSGLFCR